jgi:pyrimidine-nucleoside phosphorylase
MSPADLVTEKRDGRAHAAGHLRDFVAAHARGDVPDYQMSAWLMAAFLNGLTSEETTALTEAMTRSGDVLDLSTTPGTKVDKHSTGGVGDKVSLLLAPIVASCGVPVPMISGRGLGHTGGTLDKLESIPGLRTDLSVEAYKRQLADLGVVMIGQTDEIAPADRKLYALRDVTATVESVPLIAGSIMSKKLAEGIDALVLDVKCGRGAFMKTEPQARRLAETLAGIGAEAGTPTVALLTRMDAPLGRAAGNWPEVAESVRGLQNDTGGPGNAGSIADVMDVTLALAGEMLALGGVAPDADAGREQAAQAVRSGDAFGKLLEMVEAQGGDPSVLEAPGARTQQAATRVVEAPPAAQGYAADLDAMGVGRAALALGAGREQMSDDVDPLAGLALHKKPGDPVQPGAPLATLYATEGSLRADFDEAKRRLLGAFSFAKEQPDFPALLMDRYAEGAWTGGA